MASKKKNFAKQLHTKSVGELVKMLKEYTKELFTLRMKNAVRALKQTHLIKDKRRDIARIQTTLAAKRAENNGDNR